MLIHNACVGVVLSVLLHIHLSEVYVTGQTQDYYFFLITSTILLNAFHLEI
jgi:hypothetical protein